jgi:hypothetical protein
LNTAFSDGIRWLIRCTPSTLPRGVRSYAEAYTQGRFFFTPGYTLFMSCAGYAEPAACIMTGFGCIYMPGCCCIITGCCCIITGCIITGAGCVITTTSGPFIPKHARNWAWHAQHEQPTQQQLMRSAAEEPPSNLLSSVKPKARTPPLIYERVIIRRWAHSTLPNDLYCRPPRISDG